jgi:hypothetical protein
VQPAGGRGAARPSQAAGGYERGPAGTATGSRETGGPRSDSADDEASRAGNGGQANRQRPAGPGPATRQGQDTVQADGSSDPGDADQPGQPRRGSANRPPSAGAVSAAGSLTTAGQAAGSGTAGSGTAGSGTAGSGTAGSGAARSAGTARSSGAAQSSGTARSSGGRASAGAKSPAGGRAAGKSYRRQPGESDIQDDPRPLTDPAPPGAGDDITGTDLIMRELGGRVIGEVSER